MNLQELESKAGEFWSTMRASIKGALSKSMSDWFSQNIHVISITIMVGHIDGNATVEVVDITTLVDSDMQEEERLRAQEYLCDYTRVLSFMPAGRYKFNNVFNS